MVVFGLLEPAFGAVARQRADGEVSDSISIITTLNIY